MLGERLGEPYLRAASIVIAKTVGMQEGARNKVRISTELRATDVARRLKQW